MKVNSVLDVIRVDVVTGCQVAPTKDLPHLQEEGEGGGETALHRDRDCVCGSWWESYHALTRERTRADCLSSLRVGPLQTEQPFC
jgi:hypothetical protein